MMDRKDHRYEVELAAEVEAAGEALLAASRNLSKGGVCLDVEKPLPEGATLSVSLFLTLEGIEHADHEALVVPAQVIWCTERDEGGFTAGLQFGTLSSRQVDAVETFLRTLAE